VDDDSGELPPHLRSLAAVSPAAAAVQTISAAAEGPQDHMSAVMELVPAEFPVGGAEAGEPVAAAANGDDPQPNGDAVPGPSKAEILTRMDEVPAFATERNIGLSRPQQ